ncbi:transglycosylase domain-containing protein [Microlunatus panaciterrae]|uniref:Membrane peptidoglycan carboxypeptidase n=1 Tax=Microlunatus panaciterrae TaxID=400768 RepID=A0ABS2RKJ7_9ACTN|nr:transglycosylase domain-containing protein [Microlunatus panaciterrae]MBM7799188.1 membrane peptidoglycan carboxypeptidase [Microlunatus panaciterrae]
MPLSPKRVGSVVYSMAMFVVVSVLAGLLVAGLFVPFAGIAGVGSRAAAAELENIPTAFTTPPQSERSKVLLADGSVLAYFYNENRNYVKLDKIAPVMRQAQLAIEDHRFYEHGALDLKSTLRAFVKNQAASGVAQGGSTITQQYVKMVQIEEAVKKDDDNAVKKAQETTYARKIQELRYAIALEKELSKDQILERYLNIAYYGDGAYGIESAAQHYFAIPASKLSLPQAALLAGLVQNPDANNPVRNEPAAIDRRDVVLNRMAELKLITPAQLTPAKSVKFDRTKVKTTRNGCVGTKYPFLCDYVYRTLLQQPSLGKTVQDREDRIKRGGLTITTKIDKQSQKAAQKAVSKMVDPRDPIISTMVMIEPGTGLILGMAQSRPVMGSNKKKGETYYNYAVSQGMGGAEGYQAGSTFKAFTAAAALEKGIPLTKRYNAQRTMNFSGKTFRNCDGPFKVGGKWTVGNSTAASGVMDMYRAAAMSVNTYFVQLEQTTGLCEVTKMAKKLGVQLSEGDRDLVDYYQNVPSFTLGTAEVTPMSMAEAYATFAARGVHCNPIIVDKIKTKSGKELAAPDAGCKRVISKDVADGMNKLLSRVMQPGATGFRARIPGVEDQAGKTGTIDGNEAVWFAGYTPEVAGTAMIAIDKTKKPFRKGSANRKTNGLKNYTLPHSGTFLEGSGGGDAGMKIYKPAMEAALQGRDHSSFANPSKKVVEGKKVDMPNVCSMGPAEGKAALEAEGFTVAMTQRYSSRPAGAFLGFSQCSGSISEFATIYQIYSAGEDPTIAAERQRKAQEQAAKQKAAAEKAAAEKAAKDKAAADKKKAEQKKKKKKPGG